MSELRLSVVMPVYNVAAYLPACLDSLAAQTVAPDAIIDSSIVNARTLAGMAPQVSEPALRRLLQAQLVDGAFSVFHKADQLPPAVRSRRLRALRADGFFDLLWSNAQGFRQRRRIARQWLRSLFAAT